MQRTIVSSGTPWEPIVGYSRAVRVGPHVFVAGTTATDAQGRIVGRGDPAAQMRQALRNVEAALQKIGVLLRDVVRTRIYVTDVAHWEAIGGVHGEVFAQIRPACTLVVVAGLVDPAMLVEVEADAVVTAEEPPA